MYSNCVHVHAAHSLTDCSQDLQAKNPLLKDRAATEREQFPQCVTSQLDSYNYVVRQGMIHVYFLKNCPSFKTVTGVDVTDLRLVSVVMETQVGGDRQPSVSGDD